METEISGEQDRTTSINDNSTSTDLRSIIAIGGSSDEYLRSAEILNTTCDFPLPENRVGHIGVTTADGKTLVCGGFTETGHYLIRSCVQFNGQYKAWENHS